MRTDILRTTIDRRASSHVGGHWRFVAVFIADAFVMGGCVKTAQPVGKKDAVFDALSALIGGTWKAEGTWFTGDPFRQEHVYEWGPGKAFVKVRTSGFIDHEHTAFGPRNEGIRAWDPIEGRMKFWEFDRFGGVTVGHVDVDEKGLYYEYAYEVGGESQNLRERWQRVDENAYTFSAGVYDEGRLDPVYLEVQFTRDSE